ncbi:MAG: substrate-binding domain-containing protein [bacterium]|nr:substrate-binding domain-containing protein [bacterium]
MPVPDPYTKSKYGLDKRYAVCYISLDNFIMPSREKIAMKNTIRSQMGYFMLITAVFLQTTLCSLASAQSSTGGASSPVSIKLVTCINDSGLLDRILPEFTSETGIQVDVISAGTGRALELAKAGDVDVVLVHDPDLERQFIADGYGLARYYVAQNEYAIVGPVDDPAHIASASNVMDAFRAIMDSESTFISRGDNSAINIRELEIWGELDATPSGSWYIQSGSPTLGAMLTMTNEMEAYTLTDTGTFRSMEDNLDIVILYPESSPSGESMLLNIYSIVSLNPDLHPDLRQDEVDALIEWITGPEGQNRISDFQMNGHVLYTVNPDGYADASTQAIGN